MALWAFHNNPGIGGFGESTPPILLDGTASRTNTCRQNDSRRQPKKQDKRLSSSSSTKFKDGIKQPNTIHCYDDHSYDGDTTRFTANKQNSIADGDLLCQIVKELVDNAVDACRSDVSVYNVDGSHSSNRKSNHKKRIRVDIRSPSTNGGSRPDGVLQITVTDNGCGMENIQKSVNAFQSTKDGDRHPIGNRHGNNRNHTSGRYGIGLTLCLLHAQRCVPNSRACISSATPKSKFRTRAFFEVDKEEDAVNCVQEEVTDFADSGQGLPSGTCVSLLVPGGSAAKLAWPRLNDYFTRFRLCTTVHFELDVFAPTLSNIPIFIRPSTTGSSFFKDPMVLEKKECEAKQRNKLLNNEDWGDLLDGDDDEASDYGTDGKDILNRNQKPEERSDTNTTSANLDPHRYAFFSAVKSFWPKRKPVYNNVARSLRNIRNHDEPVLATVDNQGKSDVCLEVNMAVFPRCSDEKEQFDSSADSAASASSDNSNKNTTNSIFAGDGQSATLHMVRIVNGVPILDSVEAHSCGLVHGVANKTVWGSFGLDIDRSTTLGQDATASGQTASQTPYFRLRDNHLIAPFINKNLNHRQRKDISCDMINDDCHEGEKKKRKSERLSQDCLLPANVRLGTILVVVQIRAAPSSLPLPTLSKGRLPLNHRPIDSSLQLGLRDCLISLQSTNPVLFLTSSQLRTVEREVRYIPGIASAVSRIICRSRNPSLGSKSLELFQKASAANENYHRDSASEKSQTRFKLPAADEQEDEEERNHTKIGLSLLTSAFESRLRLALNARGKSTRTKRFKKQGGNTVKEEEYHDVDSDDASKSRVESFQVSNADENRSISLSPPKREENESVISFHSQSLEGVQVKPQLCKDLGEAARPPLKEVFIGNRPDENEDLDDWW